MFLVTSPRSGGKKTLFIPVAYENIETFFCSSVVLVNLMTGLAVSDIQALQMEGNLRHVMKQAEFLLHMENILSLSGLLKVLKV